MEYPPHGIQILRFLWALAQSSYAFYGNDANKD